MKPPVWDPKQQKVIRARLGAARQLHEWDARRRGHVTYYKGTRRSSQHQQAFNWPLAQERMIEAVVAVLTFSFILVAFFNY